MSKIDLKNLDFKTAGFWPSSMKVAAYIITFIVVLCFAWFFYFSTKVSTLHQMEGQETTLRDKYKIVQLKANNLPQLKKELEQANGVLKSLVTQLPTKNEIPQLIIDVSKDAIKEGLHIDLFQPQDEVKKNFYAEKQIDVKFEGGYEQLGYFFSDVAKEPRLISVVLDGMSLTTKSKPKTDNGTYSQPLIFKGSIRTYRYLPEWQYDKAKKPSMTKTKKPKN